jgi:hypothetical protein
VSPDRKRKKTEHEVPVFAVAPAVGAARMNAKLRYFCFLGINLISAFFLLFNNFIFTKKPQVIWSFSKVAYLFKPASLIFLK